MPLRFLVLPFALLAACSGGDDDDGDACFAAGTPVATPGGEVAIEDLHPGDPVLSLDRESGALVPARVTQVRRHRDRRFQLLELPDGHLPAGAGRGDVYDLSVTGNHVFFAAGVLVHNKTPDAGPLVDAAVCGQAVTCQQWPGLPPDTVHGYLFDGCDTPDCCVQPSDWWAAGTFADEPEEGATATPLERALPAPDGAFELTASDAARFLCAGEPLVDGDLAVVGACLELPPPRTRIDFVSGPGGGAWLGCGQF